MEADSGSFSWGVTTTRSYFPTDNTHYFEDGKYNLVDWLRQYSTDKDESFIRGFLGKMLFREEALKKTNVLSGRKSWCMLSKMMLSGANVLIFDGPTNHLDLESITAVNEGLTNFKGTILFTSHDHEFAQTVANRIIDLSSQGSIKDDKYTTYDECRTSMSEMNFDVLIVGAGAAGLMAAATAVKQGQKWPYDPTKHQEKRSLFLEVVVVILQTSMKLISINQVARTFSKNP